MNKISISIALGFLLYCVAGLAQNAVKIAVIKGEDSGQGVASIELSANKYIVAANNNSGIDNNVLFAIDSNGQMLWYREFSHGNFDSGDWLFNLVADSQGNIYTGGRTSVWNSYDPALFKFSEKGDLIFDSAYRNITGKDNMCGIYELQNNRSMNGLFSANYGLVGSTRKVNIQEFNYNGARIRNKFYDGLNGIVPANVFLTDSGRTITMFGDSAGKYLFFFKIDTAGNILVRKKLAYQAFPNFFDDMTRYRSFLLGDGRLAFFFQKNTLSGISKNNIVFYTANGDSIKKIVFPDSVHVGLFVKGVSQGCLFLGDRLLEIDTSLTLKDLGQFFPLNDSVSLLECTLSKTGRIFGTGKYWGGIRVSPPDFSDVFFFMSDRQKSMTGPVKFKYTGIKEAGVVNPSISVYPNPVSSWLNIGVSADIEVLIYDITGRMIYGGNEKTINMSQFVPGIYVINISYGRDKRVSSYVKIVKD